MKRFSFFIITSLLLSAITFWVMRVYYSQDSASILIMPNWDLYTYFFPMLKYAFSSIKAGILPLWNPYQSCGIPMLATQSVGIFYPLNILYIIFPAHTAMGISFVLHIFLAGLFMYLLCKKLLFSQFGSALAAFTFMLSGSILSTIYQTNRNSCAIWIPLIFLMIEKLLERRNLKWAILLGVSVSIQFFSGYMQYFIYTLYAALIYTFFRLIQIYRDESSTKGIYIIVFYFFVGAVITVGLSSIQLLPTYELSKLSIRSTEGLSWVMATKFGSVSPGRFLKEYFFSARQSYPLNGYIGFLPFIIAFISIFNRKEMSRVIFFFVLCIMSAFLSFGSKMPLYKIYYSLPTGNWLRSPQHFLYLFTFSLSILCGIGGNHLYNMSGEGKTAYNRYIFSIITIISLSLIIIYRSHHYLIICSGFIILVLWLLPITKNKYVKKSLYFTAIALITFNFFYVAKFPAMHPSINIDIYGQKDASNFLYKHQGFYRTCILKFQGMEKTLFTEKQAMLNGIYCINDYESYTIKRHAEFCWFLEKDKLPAITPYTASYINFSSDTKNIKLINLLSTKYILANPGVDFIKGKNNNDNYKLVYDNKVTIYENQDALPRAYFVNDYKIIKNKIDILKELAGNAFNPENSVILEEEINMRMPAGEKYGSEKPVVAINEYNSENVKITATVGKKGILVLTDMFYPGWEAYVDGEKTKIYCANYLLRAVCLEPGRHEISFIYNPDFFHAGKIISAASLTMIMIFFLGYIFKKNN